MEQPPRPPEQPQYQPEQPYPGQSPHPPPPPAARQDDVLQTIIPWRNAPALIGYYLAVFSLIPCFGLFLGLAALILGIKGWQLGRQRPEFHGKAHALVGMILGGLMLMLNLAAIVWFILQAHH